MSDITILILLTALFVVGLPALAALAVWVMDKEFER